MCFSWQFIPASKVYEVLDKLMKKGLAAHIIKNNVKHFEAANPKQLEDYVAKKKNFISCNNISRT